MGKQDNLRKLRVFARACLAAGVATSVAANIAASDPDTVDRAVAAVPPLFLFLAIELLLHIPATGGWSDQVRIGATVAIAGGAAWLSYSHMAKLADGVFPLVVDGFIVVASLSLLKIGQQIRPARKPDQAPKVASITPSSGDRAAELRQFIDGGMTQKDAAAKVGISERTARRWLNETEVAA